MMGIIIMRSDIIDGIIIAGIIIVIIIIIRNIIIVMILNISVNSIDIIIGCIAMISINVMITDGVMMRMARGNQGRAWVLLQKYSR